MCNSFDVIYIVIDGNINIIRLWKDPISINRNAIHTKDSGVDELYEKKNNQIGNQGVDQLVWTQTESSFLSSKHHWKLSILMNFWGRGQKGNEKPFSRFKTVDFDDFFHFLGPQFECPSHFWWEIKCVILKRNSPLIRTLCFRVTFWKIASFIRLVLFLKFAKNFSVVVFQVFPFPLKRHHTMRDKFFRFLWKCAKSMSCSVLKFFLKFVQDP